MDSKRSLDTLLGYLNRNYTSKEKRDAFWEECKKSRRLEMACIAACEVGELGSESIAHYLLEMKDFNTPGLIGGITFGLFYALQHVYRHGRSHSKDVSLLEAFSYVVSAESACVVSATGVEYGLGLAVSQPPLSSLSLLVRGVGLIPAFGLGLAAMSGVAYFQNREAGRFLADKKSLEVVHDYIANFDGEQSLSLSDNQLRIEGEHSSLDLVEKKVPKSLRKISSLDDSLYVVRSAVCRYDLSSREIMAENTIKLFNDAGIKTNEVHNLFKHTH